MTKRSKMPIRPIIPSDTWYPALIYWDTEHGMQYTAMPAGNYPGKFFFDVQVEDGEGGWYEEYHSDPDYNDIDTAHKAALEWRDNYLKGYENDQTKADQ